MKSLAFLLVLMIASAAFAQTTRPALTLDEAMSLLEDRPAWGEVPPVDAARLPRHPAEKALAGLTIVLDPGHGGDAHLPGYKRGPTGVREAEANLRVAKLLEKLLVDAGVNVILTRDVDRDLSLADRAGVANDADADLFVSLHHNAAGEPGVNYTSVWVHGDLSTAGPELDAARHVARSLGKHLRTDVAYTAPVMSDRQIYRGGFGVLRASRVPAFLVEASFHTNPDEERRLTDAAHNLREAYGVYQGLIEWAHAGRPTQTIGVERDGDQVIVTADLDTGLPQWWGDEFRGPVVGAMSLFADGERLTFDYDVESRRLNARLPAGSRRVTLHHENVFGQRNGPREFAIETEADAVTLRPIPPNRPDRRATTRPAERVERPWLDVSQRKLPIVLLDGGATAASQAVFDQIDMPPGSAMTIAKLDPADGGVRAVRWRDSGDAGFYPASTVKLATALMTLRQLHDREPDRPFESWRVSLAGEEPTQVEALLRDMIADSDNDAFNTLQEVAGFAETAAFLKDIGADTLAIRRHFTRPHWNHSRPATLSADDGLSVELPARPAPDLPMNAAGGESNWASTDDFVRLLAATFVTSNRDLPGFGDLADAMRDNNEPFVGRGLAELGDFQVWGKPGWWPPDGNFVDAAYVYDAREDAHYLVALHWQGPPDGDLDAARAAIADVVKQAFSAIRDGSIRL